MSPAPHFLHPLLGSRARDCQLFVAGQDEPLAHRLETAFDSATRKRGLLGRASLPTGHALIIAPCNLVHTFRMQFPIDLIYAARDGRIVKVRRGVGPARVSGAVGAFATIEMAAGSAATVPVGQVLEVR